MRNISPELIDEYTSKSVQPAYLAELFFDSGTLRLWSGYGELEWNGNTYFGGGNLIGLSPIEETQDIQAKGVTATLNGIPSNIVALVLSERSRGRKFSLYLATVSASSRVATEDEPGLVELENGDGFILLENNIISAPYRFFKGLMDVIEITDNGTNSEIRLTIENALIVGRRNKVRRYTKEDQKIRYPNDDGLNFINQLQDKELVW